MSGNKRRRNEDHYGSHTKYVNHNQSTQLINPTSQQPIILNSLAGEQYIDGEQLQCLINATQNGQSALLYVFVPTGNNDSIPGHLIIPKHNQTSITLGENLPELSYFTPTPSLDQDEDDQEDDDVVFVEDNLKQEEEIECVVTQERPQNDPLALQIQTVRDGNNVTYSLVPQYEEGEDDFEVLNNLDSFPVKELPLDALSFKALLYKCDTPGCLKTFATAHEKKIHSETHIFPANTEFKCAICNMVFDRASDRNKHVDSHAVVDTYSCKVCKKSFPYYTTMVKHINEDKCSSNGLHTCPNCSVLFVGHKDFRSHQQDMKRCPCHVKLCSDKAFNAHTALCSVYNDALLNARKRSARCKKVPKVKDEVIVLD